ncbi:MAG: transposase [Azoarcus sp.]|nr:transposase [Azoarcus sp.]
MAMMIEAAVRADPAYVARIIALAREVAQAWHGGKAALYAAAAGELAVSVATVKRDLAEVTGRQRKVRADAGRCMLDRAKLEAISAMLMAGYRANNKKILTVQNAAAILRREGAIRCETVDRETGEIKPVSRSTLSRALKANVLHPAQLRRARPAVALKSLHPNHCWEIDASISTLFYVPQSGGIADMPPGEFYKNKPQNFEKIKKERLTRYCITDHYSGWIFVHYVRGGESVANMADALIRCMVKRDDRAMHGVPFLLMADPGSAPKSGAVGNLCRRLQIEIIINRAGNARAKGQVEKAHDIVETDFESGFKFTAVPGLDWINEQAARWCVWFNATKIHSRHKSTRHAKWMEIAAGKLRTIDEPTARRMLTATPQRRAVDDFLAIHFEGRRWSVQDIPGVHVGEKLNVAANPFDRDAAYIVDIAPDGSELLHEIRPIATDEGGFASDARVIGEGHRALPDTVADTNRKAMRRALYAAVTDKDADKAERNKTPAFGGRIDPYKRFDDLPPAIPLPRRGTALEVAAQIAAAPLIPLTHFEAARALVVCGVAMDAEKNRLVAQWYPAGVPETDIAALAERLGARANLRLIG